jgi:DNA end-binding protein Ku
VGEQTGRVVNKDHKVRGYELSKGKYVEIDEEELDAVKLESTHTIEIDDFVPTDDIDERCLDTTSSPMAKRVRMRSWSFATP